MLQLYDCHFSSFGRMGRVDWLGRRGSGEGCDMCHLIMGRCRCIVYGTLESGRSCGHSSFRNFVPHEITLAINNSSCHRRSTVPLDCRQ